MPFVHTHALCSHTCMRPLQVVINVLKTLAACSLPPTLACAGAARPLNATSTPDASFFHGVDGLGDVATLTVKREDVEGATERDGVATMVQVAKEAVAAGMPLTVVTIGPLTNLAIAMREAPEAFESSLIRLVVMGGSANGRGNASRLAEFNVFSDPDAASVVFKGWRGEVTVVSWDLCVEQPLPWGVWERAVRGRGEVSATHNLSDPRAARRGAVSPFVNTASPLCEHRQPPL